MANQIGSSAFSKMYGWSQSAPNQAPERRNHRLADENKTRVKSASGIYPIYKQVFTPCGLNSKSEIGFVYSEAGLIPAIPVNLRQVKFLAQPLQIMFLIKFVGGKSTVNQQTSSRG